VKPLSVAPTAKTSDYVKYDGEGPFWTEKSDGEVKLRFAETGYASEKFCKPRTVIELFALAAKKRGDKIALRTEGFKVAPKKGETIPPALPLSQWKTWTWKQYYDDSRSIAKALMEIGMKQHDSVNVFGFNSTEWFIGQMSAIVAGGKVAGIYPSDTPDQVQFKSFHSNAVAALLEDEACLKKFSAVVEDLPYLKAIVTWSCEPGDDIKRSDGTTVKTYSWKEFLELGRAAPDADLDERIKGVRPGHCCGLIYTSGTTGKPKAVMISHDNLIFEAGAVLPSCGIGLTNSEERIVSYLPLSHVAGMMVDIIAPILCSALMTGWCSINFARPYDLKLGSIGDRLRAVRPTLFLGVPRVWEKISEKLKAVGATTTGLKKKLSTKAKAKALIASTNMQLGGSGKTPFMFSIYSALLKKIKQALGLDLCKFAFAGAAPMTKDCLEYFGQLNININEVYGMSECTGATTWSTEVAHTWGTVGYELPGTEVKILKKNAAGKLEEVERAPSFEGTIPEKYQGEVCFRGRHVMMGYLANPALGEDHCEEIRQKNAEAVINDGAWLCSGDKGAKDQKGMVKITGRYKELIIGAGGENIAPVPIEDNIKRLAVEVSNIMMVGDKRKFNIALITLKCNGATGEVPGTTKLMKPYDKWGATIKDACENKDFIKYLTKAIEDTNKNGDCVPSNAAKIQKFTILPIDFSVVTDDLTATLKLKRSVVNDKYIDLIDAVYESKETFVPYSVVAPYSSGEDADDETPTGSFKGDFDVDVSDIATAVEGKEDKDE